MAGKHHRLTNHQVGNHRGVRVTVVAGLLGLAGVTCIGVAVRQPTHAPEPPLSIVAARDSPIAASPDRPVHSTAPRPVAPVLPASDPVRISIPAIGVQSALQLLGQTAKGTIQTPPPGPHYDEAGWYRYSPAPGSIGPAIIAGHVDSARNGRSVFYRLGSMRPHDTVLITRADGSVAVFAVDEVRRYAKTRFPTALVYGNTNRPALRLITCGGAFDHNSRSYLDNIVVFASLAPASTAA